MASLAVQLAIYGGAWLFLGVGYRLKREVALLWAAGWFCGAACTALSYCVRLDLPISRDLWINSLVVAAFMFLSRGVGTYTGHRSTRWDVVAVGAGILMIEVLRETGARTLQLRVGTFTAVACWPLVLTAWRMAYWLRMQAKMSPVLVLSMVSPVLLTIGIFVVRALLVFRGVEADRVDFESTTQFGLASALLFLLVLGAFNFSLASMVLGSLIDRLHQLSATDQLTGLANRRVMMRRLEEEHARYQRSGHGYAVVMIDLDYFKKVNDTYGHGVGDQVLRGLAAILQTCQRRTDTIARTGGEEFMLLMPLTDVDGALAHARRICDNVSVAYLPTDAGNLQVTLSLGVAEVLPAEDSVDCVVSRADAALYKAKGAGRNCVQAAQRADIPAQE
jgi:diguanylate cyclase (GGDEF)-like protein